MSYFAATRHPWACLVFLLPLLATYELGVAWIGGQAIPRNGADTWLRWALERYGFNQLLAAPLLIVSLFTLRTLWSWKDRPGSILGVVFGMLVESLAYAVLLWMISRNFAMLLDQAGITLQVPGPQSVAAITYVGAGIYEEVLFRLVLFSVLVFVFRLTLLATPMAVLLASVLAALAFAAAHHIGPYGEAMNSQIFLFRFCAGLFFTALYVFRGFGIAVGAHAAYDVLAGVVVAQT